MAFSQGKTNVDSLINVAEKYLAEDTIQIKRWITISKLLYASNPQKGLESADKALVLAQKIGHAGFTADAYLLKGGSSGGLGLFNNSIDLFKQALPIYESLNNRPRICDCLIALGVSYSRMQEAVPAIAYYEKAKIACMNAGLPARAGDCLNGIASAYLNSGQAAKSISYLEEGLKLATEQGDKIRMARYWGNLGMANMNLSDYPKSLDYYHKALPVFESANDRLTMANIYNNMSKIYQNLEDFQKSLDYQLKSLAIEKELNNRRFIALNLNNVGTKYSLLKDHKQAINYYQQALEIEESLKDSILSAISLYSIGSSYIDLGEYARAHIFIEKALKILEVKPNDESFASSFVALGRIYTSAPDNILGELGIAAQDRFAKAEGAYLQAIKYAELADLKPFLFSYLLELSKLYETNGNYVKAYQAFSRYVAIKDSISGDEVKKQITRKEIQYEFDKKEAVLKYEQQITTDQLERQRLLTIQQEQALALNRQTLTLKERDLILSNKEKDLAHLAYLQEQAEKQEKAQELSLSQEREKGKERDLTLKNLELSAQQKQNLYLIALAAMLVAGLGALLYFYATLKKQKNIIAQQNELNEHTIAILSHDIKGPLMGVNLLLKKLNKEDPFVAQASHSLETQINAVNNILNNLLRMKKMALTQKDKNAVANVNVVVNHVLQELAVAIQSKAITIQNELKGEVSLPIAPEKLQIILNNLLSNAVKYSFANSSIRIYSVGKGIGIQDFGVGLSPEQRSKLMREVTTSKQGTQQERGNGIGLFLVGALLQGESLNIVFDTPDSGGTIVKLLDNM
ncbi:MAG: tetratricopeptide repeat protein [Saprospiraceae bacterium]|nr:tetratricopeptide repeat protein [Saprospiraceae bacterium]